MFCRFNAHVMQWLFSKLFIQLSSRKDSGEKSMSLILFVGYIKMLNKWVWIILIAVFVIAIVSIVTIVLLKHKHDKNNKNSKAGSGCGTYSTSDIIYNYNTLPELDNMEIIDDSCTSGSYSSMGQSWANVFEAMIQKHCTDDPRNYAVWIVNRGSGVHDMPWTFFKIKDATKPVKCNNTYGKNETYQTNGLVLLKNSYIVNSQCAYNPRT